MSRSGFDISYAFGEPFEKAFGNFLLRAKVEVKRDCWFPLTGNICVEFEQWRNGGPERQPSGIRVTEADYWAFILDDRMTSVVILTERLRELCETFKNRQKDTGDNGNRSYLIPLAAVFPGMPYTIPKEIHASGSV